ncbi:MAG: hypothetical protein LBJ00_06940 [Planctomycetaceae bacterium]|nr:hypothetical protein [Planctomycetaceae bacterium]
MKRLFRGEAYRLTGYGIHRLKIDRIRNGLFSANGIFKKFFQRSFTENFCFLFRPLRVLLSCLSCYTKATLKFPKLNTQAQQREAVVQGRSLSPYRLRYKNLPMKGF